MFVRNCVVAALMFSLAGCEIFNGKLPRNFSYLADCSHLDDCLLEACEACQESCVRPCWRSMDDTAVNFGCPDGEIIHGLRYCHE